MAKLHALMPGLPWIWISMDISMDISTSFSMNCHITYFEYKLIPLAIQFSLRT